MTAAAVMVREQLFYLFDNLLQKYMFFLNTSLKYYSSSKEVKRHNLFLMWKLDKVALC